jgi:hypothetical protein
VKVICGGWGHGQKQLIYMIKFWDRGEKGGNFQTTRGVPMCKIGRKVSTFINDSHHPSWADAHESM